MRLTRRLRIFGLAGSALMLVLLGYGAWRWHQLQQSLPPLDGNHRLPGLSSEATLARDSLGTVSVRAASADDAARTLGFAHGQDRFFQMDLLRRRAAGELSALIGRAGLDTDRSTRVHRFRERAGVVLGRESPERRARLAAYAEGVNAGLASLDRPPWEYLALDLEPEPWTPTDSVLVIYAMTFDLQDSTGRYERTLGTLRDQLGQRAVDFFNPLVGPADGALDGTEAALPPPPDVRTLDLRRQADTPALSAADRSREFPPGTVRLPPSARGPANDFPRQGSNAFVTAARHPGRSALLAGDPHLDLRVPNTWYRARLEWTEPDGTSVRVTGATLPGMPAIVIGTNGRLAWTFTSSYADTGDLVALDLNQTAPEIFYHRGRDMLEFERRVDTLLVQDGDPVTVESVWTVWGPVIGRTARGKQLVYKWTMHDPAAVNLAVFDLATASSVDEGIAIAHRSGIPPQSMLLADADGRAAWTIVGRLPRRFGFDGRLPVSWTFGDRGWDGFLPPDEIPVVRAEPGAALWSANQRPLGGDALARLGDGGYFEGDRAGQIRDRLGALDGEAPAPAGPTDFLAVQLDVRGRWLDRWRNLLLATLDDQAVEANERRATMRRLVQEGRELSANIDAVDYRLVREWHDRLKTLTLDPIFASCVKADPGFTAAALRTEEALWSLHREEPQHLLAPNYESWRELRLAAADAVLRGLDERGVEPAEATWGERNRAAIRHPLSAALPFGLGRWVNLPPQPLPGDHHLPRVQRPAFGASLRLVVAPGREDEGILHLPGGQSSHPLSPYYRAGHAAWARGEAIPLLPGAAEHTLTLRP